MKNGIRWRSWLLGLALGVLLILLAAPSTRWLVRAQIAAAGLSFMTPAAEVQRADEARRQAVYAHPDDLPLQLAAPQGAGDDPHQVAYLRTLTPRFPDSPALYADLLRHEIGSSENKSGVYLSRAEDWALSSSPPPTSFTVPPPPDAAALAAFDADAAAGERLDPDNAFFPMMRAVGLFAGRHDEAASAAVLRAGKESAWREYVQDEVNGRVRLADAAYGHGSAISRVAIVAAVLYPYYASLRGVARVATAKAAQAELAGQTEQGMALRRALLHSGGLMRADSSSYIGSLVGIAIASIATARPGGTPAIRSTPGHAFVPNELAQRRLDAFCAYARRVGHPEAAQEAQGEAAASQAVRTLWKKAEDRSVLGGPQMAHLAGLWVGDLLILANAFWLVLLGAAAAGLTRVTSVSRETPMPRPALWGLVTMLLTVAWGLSSSLSGAGTQDNLLLLGLFVVVPTAGLMGRRLWRASPAVRDAWQRDAGRFVRAFLLTGLALLALGSVAVGQARGVIGFADAVRQVTSLSGSDDGTTAAVPQAEETKIMVVAASLVLPLLMLIVFSIVGRVRRVPVSVALVRSFRAAGLPLACVLVAVYGVLLLATMRQERTMADGVAQMVRHEGRYYASLADQPWPGAPDKAPDERP